MFLEIHPFQDGNGRLSRVLTTLLLLQAGYAYVPYSSLESVIEANKQDYYLALRQTQGTIRTERPDWQPWLVFFLRSLAEQVRRLEKKVERERIVLATLPDLSLQIVEFARDTHEGQGESIVDSATTAMYQRFRPVLMTAFTTFLGTLPMVLATGAGSGARRSIGTTLFSGMSMATILGILFIPALYVIFQTLREKLKHMLHISSEPRSEEHQEEVS